MDQVNFDQVPVSSRSLGEATNFLKETGKAMLISYNDEIIGVELPASVELAAYRVVQESLTNALRYAQAPTRVRLAYTGEGLDLLVEDDGPDATGAGLAFAGCAGGRGLAGLAERAQILGGRLAAGPRPGGGFTVHAWLPVPQ